MVRLVQGYRTWVIFRVKRAITKVRISADLAVEDAGKELELRNIMHDHLRFISFGTISPELK
jgi:hypothetical protein